MPFHLARRRLRRTFARGVAEWGGSLAVAGLLMVCIVWTGVLPPRDHALVANLASRAMAPLEAKLEATAHQVAHSTAHAVERRLQRAEEAMEVAWNNALRAVRDTQPADPRAAAFHSPSPPSTTH